MEEIEMKLFVLILVVVVWIHISSLLPGNGMSASAEKVGGKKYTNSLGMKFVYIQPGRFTMGSPENETQRNQDEKQRGVTISKGFFMQDMKGFLPTEMSQAHWLKIMGSNPSYLKNPRRNLPIENVSYHDVSRFLESLNGMEKKGKYRLPTEAEWEYACRAGTATPFYFGKCITTGQANFNGDYPMGDCPEGDNRKKTVPVSSFRKNPWGLYDMHGNVWEWCSNWYSRTPYELGNNIDPKGPEKGKYKVIKGGSWKFMAHDARSANRDRCAPDLGLCYIGFRLVYEPRE